MHQTKQRISMDVTAFLLAFFLIFTTTGVALASSVTTASVDAAPYSKASGSINGMVRVFLSSLGNPSALTLTIDGSYVLSTGTALTAGETVSVGFSSSTGAITLTRGGVRTNMGTYFSLRRLSASGASGIRIAQARKPSNPYPGDISFRAVQQSGGTYKLYTIAHVYMENYLCGVLPYEMGSGAPAEALKAQAVAARTYTVRMMANRAGGYYDVVDTTNDQTYNGTPSSNAACISAVDATKGIVLKNGGSYTATYYSASNGGQTESIRNIWGTSGLDYLGVKDDPFDLANPDSVVKRATVYASAFSNGAALLSLLKTKAVAALQSAGYAATLGNTELTAITDVTLHSPMYASPSRVYSKADFSLVASTAGAQATVTVTAGIFTELESLLGLSIQSSKNELWSVVKSGGNFILEARRFGHGLGLSQRGAMYMGKLGYAYDQILGFYFEGSTRVGITFTNSILSGDGSSEIITDEPAAPVDGSASSGVTAMVKLTDGSTSLYIRASKTAAGAVLGKVANSAPVTVYSSDGTWCLIGYGRIVGYVPANTLTINGTPEANSDQNTTAIQGFATVTANGFLNLRSQGSFSGSVVTTAPNGAVLTVLSTSGSWAFVQYNATAAYASTDFLSMSATYPGDSAGGDGGTVPDSGAGTGTEPTATVRAAQADLRLTADDMATMLMSIPYGQSVVLLERGDVWCSVRYEGVTGFVRTESLTLPATDDGGENNTGTATAVVITQSGSLNLRSAAQAGSAILTTIPRGATVTVTQRGSTWTAVRYGNQQGFVMTAYLQFTGGAVPELTPEPGTVTGTAVVTTASGSLNMRQAPQIGSSILQTIPRGATVTVQVQGATWSQVSYSGVSGHVMSVFLTFNSASVTAGPSVSPSTTPDTSTAPDASATPINTEPTPPPTDTPTPNTLTATVSTSSGSLNLRADMLPGSSILARIPKGTRLTIAQKMEAWSQTSFGGYTGYVMNAYLTFASDGTGNTPGATLADLTATVVTASGSLNLRSQPNGSVLAAIPQYATVRVLAKGDPWSQIQYAGISGYAMSTYLSFVEGTATPSPSEGTPTPLPTDAATEVPSATAAELFATVMTPSGSLNLRAAQSTSSQILTTIPRLSQVVVLEQGDPWSRVSYMTQTGYAQSAYLSFSTAGTATTSPAPTATQTTGSGNTQPAWVNTDSGALNLRMAASSSAATLMSIPRLAQVKVIQTGSEWSLVEYAGVQGYVMSRYLTTVEPEQSIAPTQMDPALTATPATNTQTPNPSISEDPTLRTPESLLTALIAPQGGTAYATLYAFCTQDVQHALLDMLAGVQVEVKRRGETWSEVVYYGLQGFCMSSELAFP